MASVSSSLLSLQITGDVACCAAEFNVAGALLALILSLVISSHQVLAMRRGRLRRGV
jgi:hypothetical protein